MTIIGWIGLLAVITGLLAAVGMETPDLLANYSWTVPLAVAIVGLLLLLLDRKNWGGESNDD